MPITSNPRHKKAIGNVWVKVTVPAVTVTYRAQDVTDWLADADPNPDMAPDVQVMNEIESELAETAGPLALFTWLDNWGMEDQLMEAIGASNWEIESGVER